MSASIYLTPNKLSISINIIMWSLNSHHYGDKETMDNTTSLDPNQRTIDTNDQNPAQQKRKKMSLLGLIKLEHFLQS